MYGASLHHMCRLLLSSSHFSFSFSLLSLCVYMCVDRALLSYHTLKIREVNKIIKELWQLIYRGEDIDNIEIVSGIEDGETIG